MALFRMTEKRDWAKDLLDNGVLPSIHNGYGYTGISALKNSDVLTAVGILGSMIGRYDITLVDDHSKELAHDSNLEYLLNKKPSDKFNAYEWRFAMTVNALLTGDGISRIVRDPRTSKPGLIEFYRPSDTYIDDSDPVNVKYIFYTSSGT